MNFVPLSLIPSRLNSFLLTVSLLWVSIFLSPAFLCGQDAKVEKKTEVPKAEEIENPFPNRHPAPELEGRRMAERSRTDLGQRPAWKNRVDRLLDFLLHQLHACPS